MGMLLGIFCTGLCPALVQAQGSTDPVPLATAGPAPGGAMPMGAANVPPHAGYVPGMAGPMPPPMIYPPLGLGDANCGPGCKPGQHGHHGKGLLSCLFARNAEDIDDDRWHCLLYGGYTLMTRSRLKGHSLAVLDPETTDDGVLAPADARSILSFDELDPSETPGWKGGFGFYREGWVFEFGGFQIPRNRSEVEIINPGRISSFFFNPPLGFEGTNFGLWDNADLMRVDFSNGLWGVETNFRWINNYDYVQSECFIGIRYVDLAERLNIFTDDDSLQFAPDPLSQATYSTWTRNHMLGLQAGLSLHQDVCGFFGVSWDVRGSWLANMTETNTRLVRGDGFVGFEGGQTLYGFSQIYETGLFLDFTGSFWRIRSGYNFMVLTGVATAQNVLNFNLEQHDGNDSMRGTTMYHGLIASLELFF
jgi:hypothetical protein